MGGPLAPWPRNPALSSGALNVAASMLLQVVQGVNEHALVAPNVAAAPGAASATALCCCWCHSGSTGNET